VDFDARSRALAEEADLPTLLMEWQDGRVKQALIARLLCFRARHARLFAEGDYQPLTASGPQADRLIAFTRRCEREILIVVAPRLTARSGSVWQDAQIQLPQIQHAEARNLLQRGTVNIDGRIDAAALLSGFPLAALYIGAG
jgi:maltooligosyltrehalose synthase